MIAIISPTSTLNHATAPTLASPIFKTIPVATLLTSHDATPFRQYKCYGVEP